MVNIVANQRVAKRRKPSLLYTRQRDSEVFGADFIREMRQKPARHRRSKTRNAAPAFWSPRPRFLFSRKHRPAGGREQVVSERKRPAEQRGSGFSFPIPSLASMAVIAGTLLISLLALNWDGISLSFPAAEHFTLQPAPDTEGRRNLASYAGLPLLTIQTAGAGEEAGGEIPLDLIETFEWSSYTVQRGDTVSKIAAQFALSMDAIIASNNIRNARRLQEGETLRIPNMDGIPYTVKKGDTLLKISASMGVPLEVILDANDIRSDAITQGEMLIIPGARMPPEALKQALGDLPFSYPVKSRVTSPYGWRVSPITGQRHFHAAVDFAGGIGTPVTAAMDGTVSSAGTNPTFGKFIILSHAGGYQTMYAHLSVVSVKQGERVNQGSTIGKVGSTGLSTGPHLHFAAYKNGRAVNPLDLLN
jgi:murein DD-endopeptidase MepM/ murein hydrolase activator NlpD